MCLNQSIERVLDQEFDHCVYIEKNLIIATIYVHDILILSNNKQSLWQMKDELKRQFKISNLESAKHLKIEIYQIKKKICLTQIKYIIWICSSNLTWKIVLQSLSSWRKRSDLILTILMLMNFSVKLTKNVINRWLKICFICH